MQEYAPVVMDVTHSLQQPNQSSSITGGQPQLIETIAKAAIASGVDGVFIETHLGRKMLNLMVRICHPRPIGRLIAKVSATEKSPLIFCKFDFII